jgi:hypothetical protein
MHRVFKKYCQGELLEGVAHLPALGYYINDKALWESYFTFSMVRNPWDRMLSYYIWRKTKRWGHEAHKRSFDEWLSFVKECRDTGSGESVSRDFAYATQQQFDLLSIENTISLDFIGRFENLKQDFIKICELIGVPNLRLPTACRTRHKNYSTYYSSYAYGVVAELFKKDIDYFKYVFEK